MDGAVVELRFGKEGDQKDQKKKEKEHNTSKGSRTKQHFGCLALSVGVVHLWFKHESMNGKAST